MIKRLLILIVMTLFITSCAEDSSRSVGFLTSDTKLEPNTEYCVIMGNVIWSVFTETLFIQTQT